MPQLPKDLVGKHYELLVRYHGSEDQAHKEKLMRRMDDLWCAANEAESNLITAQVKLIDRPRHGSTA